jgi:protein-tyrosine phosphatase
VTDAPGPPPARLLFVCTANRVRSPFAEAVARGIIDSEQLDVAVASAGTEAESVSAVVNMVEVAAKMGFDLSEHVSRRVDTDLTTTADLIVTMTGEHVMDVIAVDPGATNRTITLQEFADATQRHGAPEWNATSLRAWAAQVTDRPISLVLGGALDVADPIGGPKRAYRRTAREITDLLTEAFGSPAPT